MISRQERVQRGAALLDKAMPGWARKIKLRRLNMLIGNFSLQGSGCGCIGAQLDTTINTSGDWRQTLQTLRIGGQAASHGFDLYAPEFDYDELTELWKDEVRARR